MRWAELVADTLAPSFGGFPTFCSDPDDLLEDPLVREALAKRGVSLFEWEGDREALRQWESVAEESKPVIKIVQDARMHLIDEALPEAAMLSIGVSVLFPKLDPDVVRAVPRDHWDSLLRLQEHERPLRTRRESALMVARVVYGVDHAFVRERGWERAVAQIATCGEALPDLLIEELLAETPLEKSKGLREALRDSAAARAFTRVEETKTSDPVVGALRLLATRETPRAPQFGEKRMVAEWSRDSLSPVEVQSLALQYGFAVANGLSLEVRRECNKALGRWLRRSYDMMLTSQNPSVHRIHRLADTIDRTLGADKGVVFVIDALGIEAWSSVKKAWTERKIIGRTEEDAAFAVIPTLTSWSRRAFFEGRLPPQFGQGNHGPALERRLWESRFERGRYFDAAEELAFQEAVYQGVPRIAVVDVAWDKRGHAIDPDYDSLSGQARTWGMKTRTAELVREALVNGYRVFLTADHGQVEGSGIGPPNVGSVPEERSKRVLVFSSEATRDSHKKLGDNDFLPITVPKGTAPLFARYGEAFDLRGASSFSHGGCSIEEVMVPFVELMR